jgi:hypothetical protein
MAKLTTKQRNALPDSAFAGPHRSYPVEDKAHAAQFASTALKAKVDRRADAVLGHGHKNVRNVESHEYKLRHG